MLQEANCGQTVDGRRSRTKRGNRDMMKWRATIKQSVGINGYNGTIDGDGIGDINTMKINHCNL